MIEPHVLQWRRDTWQQDKRWRGGQFERLPVLFREPIYRDHARIYRDEGQRAGNTFLRETADEVAALNGWIAAAASDAQLCEAAEKIADRLGSLCATEFGAFETRRAHVLQLAARIGAELPQLGKRGVTAETQLKRVLDPLFWRRQIRKLHIRRIEAAAIRLGMVRRGVALYVSDEAMHRIRHQRRRNRQLLEQSTATNEEGQQFTLAELADVSVSNPALRRNELMVRIRGFEEIARELGHVGLFITISCPSRYHAAYADTGKRNPKYAGTTPRDAQDYLTTIWAQARAQLHREGVNLYGFRVVEPHHDGCPHWHLLVFCPPEHKQRALAAMALHACKADAAEIAGKRKSVRFKVKLIDWQRGSAAGYIAKYVAKNIDGKTMHGDSIGDNFDGVDATTGAERVTAWAALWGIRQFQQIGTAPVTLWRELRRMHATALADGVPAGDSMAELLRNAAKQEQLQARFGAAVGCGALWQAALAADVGDWSNYIKAVGGVGCRRGDLAIMPLRQQQANRYGEQGSAAVQGVAQPSDRFAASKAKTAARQLERAEQRQARAAEKAIEWAEKQAQRSGYRQRQAGERLAIWQARQQAASEAAAQARVELDQAAGVAGVLDVCITTRIHEWTIERAQPASGAPRRAWTRVNNCTAKLSEFAHGARLISRYQPAATTEKGQQNGSYQCNESSRPQAGADSGGNPARRNRHQRESQAG